MKQIVLLCMFMGLTSMLYAQDQDALRLVAKNKTEIGLTDADLGNIIVTSSYYNSFAGTQMVYLQQSHLGIPIWNQLQVLAFKNGKLVSAAGERIKGLSKVNMLNSVPSVTPESAVYTAISEKKLPLAPSLQLQKMVAPNKMDFGKHQTFENITTELMWVPTETGEIKLAWQVYIVPLTTSDYWLIRVDANDNKILGETNLTVYCTFESHSEGAKHQDACFIPENKTPVVQPESPSLVGTANYRVVPYPAESPNHPGGTPALVTNPWTLAGGNATTLGWHNDGTTDYTTSRGNNVYAQEDRDNNNNTFGNQATSSTGPDPLNFDFTPNFSSPPIQTSPAPNQQFNITNLFYWNNIVHDLTYLYGFDEVSGNFQNNNQGRGGLGNDYVIADAQDAGGTNNANFATPADGSRPRMQMYLWSGSPQKDGDVDNSIIVHEYGHGISNRLTGGPTNSGCLSNAEQMGEGWSDYYGLMYTQDWANSNLNTGFSSPRGIGTYATGQTPAGTGIRSQRYCTNFAINNKVYNTNIPGGSHDRGEIWCATLWDMTWNIINQVGTINPSLFNPAGGGGNVIALRLVTEGMKLQPCSPGFISGRNAILQADMILYGGAHQCAIKEAFRRRGMGDNASQGSSGSVNDQVPDYTGGVTLTLTQNGMTQVTEGQNIVYTNTVSSTCSAINNFLITDTLPANVTYVSGGSYNPATRVVSFVVNQAIGAVNNYSFTVNVNNGSYFTPITLIDEPVASSSMPATWSTLGTPISSAFTISTLQSQSAPNSFYAENLTIAVDQRLHTVNPLALPAGSSPKFSFAHRFNTEDGWDGGVAEISTNGGSTWIDLGPYMTVNGYNGNMGNAPTNVLANRQGFTGTINSFMTTEVNLTAFASQNARFRFRFGSDDNTTATTTPAGWFIDDIKLVVSPVVNMRSSLFNASNTRVSFADTVTVIVEGVTCANTAITLQPAGTVACAGSDATFSVVATGTGPLTYQWQSATSCAGPWTNITGANSSSLSINNVTAAMNGNAYRVQISNGCPSSITSSCAVLEISGSASITSQPANTEVCPGSAASFSVTASGSNLTYQWQISTNGGTTYTNIAGATGTTLNLATVTAAMNGNLYRAIVNSCDPTGVTSSAGTLSVTSTVAISGQPAPVAVCAGDNATFSINASGAGVNYQWQISTNGGSSYANLIGETNSTLTLNAVSATQNGNMYRAVLSGTCTGSFNSTGALLNVNTSVAITAQPQNAEACSGETAVFNVEATGTTVTYQWQVSINGSPFTNITDGPVYSGTNTSQLTVLSVSETMNGYEYRVVASGVPCGGLTSQSGVLTANSKPGVVLVAAEYNTITPGTPSALYATVSPVGTYTYQWFRNNELVPGAGSSSLPFNTDVLGDYHVVVTGLNGCSSVSNIVNLNDSASNYLFIHPNPNNGQFQVRYHNSTSTDQQRLLIIYDSKGSRVFARSYIASSPYETMNVDLQHAAAGIYMAELLDGNGNRLGSGRILIR